MYEHEHLGEDDDDGTMPGNVEELAAAVVGHRIVSAERRTVEGRPGYVRTHTAMVITLDDGTEVEMFDTDDCCAYTELEAFLLHPDKVDHLIMGVGTTGGYTTWHIYADFGDVMELTVGWSCGNPFYYGYGFDIRVMSPTAVVHQAPVDRVLPCCGVPVWRMPNSERVVSAGHATVTCPGVLPSAT